MPTIFDVAKAANVSIASVSLVLRDPNSHRVGDQKRKEILRVAKEMGYRPNLLARGLSKHGTKILGLVVPMADPKFFFNLTISEIMAGIQSCLTEHSYHLLVYSHQSEKGRITQSEIIQSKATDGVIFINTRLTTNSDIAATIGELDAARIPFVMINSAQECEGINYVGVDELKAGQTAAEYLLSRGRRRMGMVTALPGSPTSDLLRRGFSSIVKKGGAEIRKQWIAPGRLEEKATLQAVESIIQQKTRPDAIFCTSDLMAPHVYSALAANGLRVPEDVSVIGRGDLMFARFLTPSLTSLAFPFFEIGYRSADLLIQSLKNPDAKRKRVLLEATLAARESA